MQIKSQRMCAVCRKITDKTNLKRWTLKDEQLLIDTAKNQPGRGFYTCGQNCELQLEKNLPRLKYQQKGKRG